MSVKHRVLWALYVLFLVAGICGVLKAAAARDRQYMERFPAKPNRPNQSLAPDEGRNPATFRNNRVFLSMNSSENLKVYAAINAVQQAMAKEGIAKDSRNQQQGYAFRGIDSVYCALAPHLAANKLCILPRVMSRHVDEKQTKSGGVLFYTTLMVEFDFVSAEDGSKHTVCTVGEAMDSGDKSSNKAMSAAYKYAAFQAFCIPTEGDNDADATTHEPSAKRPAEIPVGATRVPALISDESIAFFKLADPALVKRVIDGYKKTAFTELTEAQAQKGITFIKAEMAKAEAAKKKEEKEPF